MELQNVLNNRRSIEINDAAKKVRQKEQGLKQLSMRRYWLLHGRIYRHQDITAFLSDEKIEELDRSVCRNLIRRMPRERHLL